TTKGSRKIKQSGITSSPLLVTYKVIKQDLWMKAFGVSFAQNWEHLLRFAFRPFSESSSQFPISLLIYRYFLHNIQTIRENQTLTAERILILIRNVLQVPADPAEELRNDDDISVHDKVCVCV